MHQPSGVTPMEQAAAAFAFAFSRSQYSRFYDNRSVDIEGALHDRQAGLLWEVCQSALEMGVTAFLRDRGYETPAPGYLLEALAAACDDPLTLETAHRLYLANPEDFDALQHYTAECKAFVEDMLGVRPPKFLRGYDLPENVAAYLAHTAEVEALAAYLGTPSPFPITLLPRYIAGVTDPGVSQRSQA